MNNLFLPFRAKGREQVEDQLLSYRFVAMRKLYTYACPESDPLLHPVLTVQFLTEKEALQTIQKIFVLY